MDIGPIPLNFIWDYADRFDLDESFVEIVKRLDNEYLRMNYSRARQFFVTPGLKPLAIKQLGIDGRSQSRRR